MILNMVRNDIKEFLNSIPKDITLVVASKYIDSSDMKILLENGVNNFGENRVDSFLKKREELEKENITWHFIGHLQKNKAKKIINKIDYLHSLDSLDLAVLIEKYRQEPLPCFIEVNINHAETKNGVDPQNIEEFLSKLLLLSKVKVVGLMMMAIPDSTHESLKEQFASLRILKQKLEENFQIKIPYLSMGMSDDYMEAIDEGATHIRLGRILFR